MFSCTDERNAQILIQVLKAHGIKKVIASPGTTNACLVSSMQSDPFLKFILHQRRDRVLTWHVEWRQKVVNRLC